jgi:DNA polymerase III subunit alpha
MEKFAGYGFNKSHSAAYALLSYQTAWLKAHYPAAFMAAVLSADMDKTDKVVTLIDECASMADGAAAGRQRFRLRVQGLPGPQHPLRLGAIKGVGASRSRPSSRSASARAYRASPDLCRRIDLQRVNRRVLEALIRSGSLDRSAPNRATLMAELDRAMRWASRTRAPMSVGQVDLFGLSARGAGRHAGGGMERGAAPGGRARDARPVPERPSDHALRAGPEISGSARSPTSAAEAGRAPGERGWSDAASP